MSDSEQMVAKECYRCTRHVPLTIEQYRSAAGHYAICRICTAKLSAEVSVIDTGCVLTLPAGAFTPQCVG